MTKKILALAAFAALSCVSLAQGVPGRGMMRMFQGGSMATSMLLGREDVQAEIKLTDEQKGKLDALRAGARDRFRTVFTDLRNNGGGGSPEEMQAAIQTKMQTLMEDMSKEAMAVLDESQKKRVKELGIQSQGALVVLQKEVAKEINLTAAQQTRIDELQRLQEEATMGLFEKVQSGDIDREDMNNSMEKNRKTMDTEVAKVLTEAQRAKLKEMGGKPFEFKDPKPGTPGSFGRPGGGR